MGGAATRASEADWAAVAAADAAYDADRPKRVLALLGTLRDARTGFAVDRLTHSLQAATRALRDGQDDSYVACALLHDIGAAVAPHAHGAFAALLLGSHVSKEEQWMVAHHDDFQLYNAGGWAGPARERRERWRGHWAFARAADFAARYDEPSFDPSYDTLPLAAFAPILHRVLSARR